MKLDGRMEESEILEKPFDVIFGTAVSLVLDIEQEELGMNATSLFNASSDFDAQANASVAMSPKVNAGIVRHLSPIYEVLIAGCYLFGIVGNLAAFYIITKNETQRGRKQTFMLLCLTGNDLVALLGSIVMMFMHLYLPVADTKWFCAFRVIWRAFGLGSGCVSVVMAVDRWLALSQPFLYYERVTYAVICRSVIGLWLFNLLLVCAPFMGFGLWYDKDSSKGVTPCVRYRQGTTTVDRTYAFIVFAFGLAMCAVIVRCNISVIRELFLMRKDCMPRRHSRTSCRSSVSIGPSRNHPTLEELSLSRLMVVISIFFVVCWLPQLVSIILVQLEGTIPPIGKRWLIIADMFVALNFVFDPYVYVILRRQRRCSHRHIRKLAAFVCPTRFKPASSSLTDSSMQSHNSNNTHSKEYGTGNGSKNTVSINCTSSEKEYVPLHLLLSSSPADPLQPEQPSSLQSLDQDHLSQVQNSESYPILKEESEPSSPNGFHESIEVL